MKRIIKKAFLLIVVIGFFGCQYNRRPNEWTADLDQARDLFRREKYEEAQCMLDSILLASSQTQKNEIIALRDSVTRNIARAKVDSLNREIYLYGRQLPERKSKNEDITDLLEKVAGIKAEKNIYTAIIQEIDCKELEKGARCQCITILRRQKSSSFTFRKAALSEGNN